MAFLAQRRNARLVGWFFVPRGPLLSAADISHCVHRVALDRGGPVALSEPTLGVEIERRIRDAGDLRRRVVEAYLVEHPEGVRAQGVASTRELMTTGAPLIADARVLDDEGRRSTTIDLLVRTGRRGDAYLYAPVIIKNNEVTEAASTRRLRRGHVVSPLPATAEWVDGLGVRRNDTVTRNGLALAHATRILQSLGVADSGSFGGVIDRHEQLWWFDLANPDWGKWTLERYDEAYSQRQDVLLQHDRWQAGSGSFPTVPYWHRECLACPFREHCEEELEQHDDVSLVRFTNFDQQFLLRDHGITTRRDLARLDPDRAKQARGRLMTGAGEHTTEDHLGRSIDKLDELIYRARSIVRGGPLRIVDAQDVDCPIADVEVDVDMESYNDVTYLWGAYVTTRRDVPGVREGYVHFALWDEPTAISEAMVFAQFWAWFQDLRRTVVAQGASFASYCFWAQAEDGAMNRAVANATSSPQRAELDEFRARTPSEWIDLHDVAKRQIQTDGPLGLKVLATTAGFSWRDENPSGEASMVWFEEARATTALGLAARQRILEYNEDDCRATKALREWILADVPLLPSRHEVPTTA